MGARCSSLNPGGGWQLSITQDSRVFTPFCLVTQQRQCSQVCRALPVSSLYYQLTGTRHGDKVGELQFLIGANPVFLLRKSHGWRNLERCGWWACRVAAWVSERTQSGSDSWCLIAVMPWKVGVYCCRRWDCSVFSKESYVKRCFLRYFISEFNQRNRTNN